MSVLLAGNLKFDFAANLDVRPSNLIIGQGEVTEKRVITLLEFASLLYAVSRV